MADEQFDVVVIGGGIQGAGMAQAAAAAGYRVLIVEQHGWGSGTSSRSSKLIHGGLRYLENYQFGLVRKSLQERKVLQHVAADLAHPLLFNIPIYRGGKHRSWQVGAGLCLYAVLGGFGPLSRFRRLSRADWSGLGGLKTEGLLAVYQYWDMQTDDLQLTRAVVQSAQQLGASAHEQAEFTGASLHEDGYRVRYRHQGREQVCDCAVLVNAAGPWVTQVSDRIEDGRLHVPIDCVRGAHVEFSGQISRQAFYVQSPRDRRAVFVLPWHGDNTLVGTTESAFSGDPARVCASDEELDYLRETLRHHFPEFAQRVVRHFAGLRVLPRQQGSFASRPRESLVEYDDRARPRLVSLYGGKLTTYRATAEAAVAKIQRRLGRRPGARNTRAIRLSRPAPADGLDKDLLCIGHRGAMGHAPENTLASFATALALGAPWVELDVYLVEGELLVFHDDRLERTSNGQGFVQESSLAYLRSLDAGQGEKIPTLAEVFALIDRRAGVNIELKGTDTALAVADFLAEQRRAGWPESLVLVSSFDQEQLRALRQRDAQVALGVLYARCPTDGLETAIELGARAVIYARDFVTLDWVVRAHSLGMRCLVYTVNDPGEIRAVRELGVDGVFSNFPERVLHTNAGPVSAGW